MTAAAFTTHSLIWKARQLQAVGLEMAAKGAGQLRLDRRCDRGRLELSSGEGDGDEAQNLTV